MLGNFKLRSTYKERMMAMERRRMTMMPAMRPSLASTAMRTQAQEEVKSNM